MAKTIQKEQSLLAILSLDAKDLAILQIAAAKCKDNGKGNFRKSTPKHHAGS